MGEFTQNLLKLTEFPFSYSIIGLLALIFGQGINLQQLSFANIGPLLILMGFVATTLSICDPVGAIQRQIILGTSSPPSSLRRRDTDPDPKGTHGHAHIWQTNFGTTYYTLCSFD